MIGERWGVTAAEVGRRYPCDDLFPGATLQAWRGVTVQAPPSAVWPWVAQIQLAPYSYDWVDNLGRPSPRRLLGRPEPAVGERFTSTAGRAVGTLVSVDVGEQLTGRILGAAMSYVLVPDGVGTRLLLKVVMPGPRALAALVCAGDLVMARKQLLTFKRLAERAA